MTWKAGGEARHRLPLVHGIRQHALEARGEPDRLQRPVIRDAVDPGVVPVVEEDLAVEELATHADELGRPARDAAHLLERLLGLRGGIDPEDSARTGLVSEARDHPG